MQLLAERIQDHPAHPRRSRLPLAALPRPPAPGAAGLLAAPPGALAPGPGGVALEERPHLLGAGGRVPLLQERHDAADVGRGVARAALQRLLPVEPGDPAGTAPGDALDGPAGAVVVPVAAADVPVLDADDLLEDRREAALAAAGLSGDDADAGAVEAAADVPQAAGDGGVGDAEARVDDVSALLAGVLQGGLQDRSAGGEEGVEDPDDGQLHLGRQAADDAGAGRAVAGLVAVVGAPPEGAVLSGLYRDAPDYALGEVAAGGVEAAVDDGDAHPAPGQFLEGMSGHQRGSSSQAGQSASAARDSEAVSARKVKLTLSTTPATRSRATTPALRGQVSRQARPMPTTRRP